MASLREYLQRRCEEGEKDFVCALDVLRRSQILGLQRCDERILAEFKSRAESVITAGQTLCLAKEAMWHFDRFSGQKGEQEEVS